MHSFPAAAITVSQLNGSKQQMFVLSVSEARNPKSRCQPSRVPSATLVESFLASSWLVVVPVILNVSQLDPHRFNLCLHGCSILWVSLSLYGGVLIGTPVTLDQGPPSRPYLKVTTSAKTLFPSKVTVFGPGGQDFSISFWGQFNA